MKSKSQIVNYIHMGVAYSVDEMFYHITYPRDFFSLS